VIRSLSLAILLLACTKATSDTTRPDSKPVPGAPTVSTPVSSKGKAPMTDRTQLVREALAKRNAAGVDALTITNGPEWMATPKLTAPFEFFVASGKSLSKGSQPARYFVGIDTRTDTVLSQDKAGFETFLKGIGYVATPAKLTGSQIISGHAVITQGQEVVVIGDPSDVPSKLRNDVKPPVTTTEPDGSIVTVGWTVTEGMSPQFTKHTIRVLPSGQVEAKTAPL
jgi:hypothetical protein